MNRPRRTLDLPTGDIGVSRHPAGRHVLRACLALGLAGPALAIATLVSAATALPAAPTLVPVNPATAPARNAGSGAHTRAFAAVPGPDAMYLQLTDRWALRPDGRLVHEQSSRLQVNSYLAINRGWGESKVAWDPTVETFEVLTNRTVLPSGAVVDAPANAVVDDQPPAAHGQPLWSHLRRKVIVHTALEPGAVIEQTWRITRRADAVSWLEAEEPLQLDIPVRERVVEVDVTGREPVWQVTNQVPGMDVAPERHGTLLRWRLTNLAAVPSQPGAPPRELAVPVLWLSTAGHGAPADVMRARLAAAGDLPATAATALRKDLAATLGDDARILAALDWIASRLTIADHFAPSLQRWELRPLAAVWDAGRATPLEAAALEAASLRALGEVAWASLLEVPGSEGVQVPGLARFERPVVVVFRDTQALVFDPLHPGDGAPLDARLAGARLLETGDFPDEAAVVAGGPWQRSLTAVLTVGSQGEVTGQASLVADNGATPFAALLKDPQKVADTRIAGLVPSGKALKPRIVRLERTSTALETGIEGKLPEATTLRLVRFEIGGAPGGVDEELVPFPVGDRLAPIALPGPGSERVEIRLTLAKGWSAAALPEPVEIRNSVGQVTVTATAADGVIRVVRRLELADRVAPASRAGEVAALLAAWRAPASRVLLLRAPVPETSATARP